MVNMRTCKKSTNIEHKNIPEYSKNKKQKNTTE